jgi:hypothetical protein
MPTCDLITIEEVSHYTEVGPVGYLCNDRYYNISKNNSTLKCASTFDEGCGIGPTRATNFSAESESEFEIKRRVNKYGDIVQWTEGESKSTNNGNISMPCGDTDHCAYPSLYPNGCSTKTESTFKMLEPQLCKEQEIIEKKTGKDCGCVGCVSHPSLFPCEQKTSDVGDCKKRTIKSSHDCKDEWGSYGMFDGQLWLRTKHDGKNESELIEEYSDGTSRSLATTSVNTKLSLLKNNLPKDCSKQLCPPGKSKFDCYSVSPEVRGLPLREYAINEFYKQYNVLKVDLMAVMEKEVALKIESLKATVYFYLLPGQEDEYTGDWIPSQVVDGCVVTPCNAEELEEPFQGKIFKSFNASLPNQTYKTKDQYYSVLGEFDNNNITEAYFEGYEPVCRTCTIYEKVVYKD